MFYYCPHCALIKKYNKDENYCPACDILMREVPKQYLSGSGLLFKSQQEREKFENEIKTSEEFDINAYNCADDIIAEREKEHSIAVSQKVEQYKANRPQKECPICHSTSLSKISNLGKVVKVGALGILGAGDLGKTWKCNSCGVKF